jgi:hypothetical protein
VSPTSLVRELLTASSSNFAEPCWIAIGREWHADGSLQYEHVFVEAG